MSDYNSPIKQIMGEMKTAYENDVMKVDKDELVKAPVYDRNQYKEGFADGAKKVFNIFCDRCPNSRFTFYEDSHYEGYTYCKLLGFDYHCNFENCELMKEVCNGR